MLLMTVSRKNYADGMALRIDCLSTRAIRSTAEHSRVYVDNASVHVKRHADRSRDKLQ